MITHFIEVSNGFNWGKFMLGRFDSEEWTARSAVEPAQPLIAGRGWTGDHLFVLDLQTGEGAVFRPGGCPRADLRKHQIWVCPMFEPFLEWLYTQDLRTIVTLPKSVELPNAESSMHGYRRDGPGKPELRECSYCPGRHGVFANVCITCRRDQTTGEYVPL